MSNVVLFASGSGSNVENIVNYFTEDKNVHISLVLCNNPKAFVLERARKMSIETVVFDRETFNTTDKIVNILADHKTDLIVLAGFLWLIPDNILKAYEGKIINIHPSLLPKYGGKGMFGDKVHRAVVENKETESGITIHYVNEHFDQGEVIYQAKCVVNPEDSPDDVANKVHALEYKYFPEIIEEVLLNREEV